MKLQTVQETPTSLAAWTLKDSREAGELLASSQVSRMGDRTSRGVVARVLQVFLRRYAEAEAESVAPFVAGKRILDLGAGEGYVAVALRRRIEAWICSVDVGPFRLAEGPYVMYDGDRLPFGDDLFDTTLILLALHHCAEPGRVLSEAVRVTRGRLVVMESVSHNPWEQFWLHLLDGWLNVHRHDGGMPVPLAFRSPARWRASFESLGLRVTHERWLGSRWERLVHHPLLFVLEKAGPGVAPVERGVMSLQADEAPGERAEWTAARARASRSSG